MQITIKGKKFNEADVLPPQLRKMNERVDWLSPDFSVRGLCEAVYEMHFDGRLRETQAADAWGQLLRAGVQTIANNAYQVLPKSWEKYCSQNPSDKYEEVYPPLFGSKPWRRIGHGHPAQGGEIVGDKIIVLNLQFAGLEEFDEQLVEDDQTGQFRERAAALGEGANTTENFYAATRFIGNAGSLGGLSVGASEFTTIDTDGVSRGLWSKKLYDPANDVGNRLPAFKQLDGAHLKHAKALARSARDPLGNKIQVNCDTLFVSSMDEEAAVVLTGKDLKGTQISPWFPSVPGLSSTTASSATGGAVGSAYAANPYGLGLQPVVEPYLEDWAWAIGQAKKGLVMQTRKQPEVFQELPNSGEHFNRRVHRYAGFQRFNVEWYGNRHWVLGNPGNQTVDGDAGVTGAF